MSLKALHYINQFYAGIGGEDKATQPFAVAEKIVGPAMGLNGLWKGEMVVDKVIYCGDNYVNTDSNWDEVKAQIKAVVEEVKPDVFVAGPAFNAGRYGVACAKVCDYVRSELNVPSVTCMWHENPAIDMYVANNYIVPSTETAAGMRNTLPAFASLALKLAKKEKIGPALKDGYLPTGKRYNEYSDKSGAERVVQMLLDKIAGRPFATEVPIRGFEVVKPAPAIKDLSKTKIALFTTGGLVPVGNPDKIKQAFATSFGTYDMTGLDALEKGVYESIHGGYDTTAASNDPHRLIPMDAVKELISEGKIGSLYPFFGTTCGVGTNIGSASKMGREWAQMLKEGGVGACILTST